jgi:hypothetical protein
MAEAFVYMYFVCLGGSLGIGTTALIGWRIVKRSKKKEMLKRKSIV